MHLTKRAIDALRYRGDGQSRQVLWDDDPTGMGLRVYPSDKKSFVLSYRTGSKKRLLVLGVYGALTLNQARSEAVRIGYPVLVRPSFVLGGRAMEICYDEDQLERFVAEAFVVSQGQPVLIDSFLEDAIEVDVDAICDRRQTVVAGVMEHIEEAGVHSGDSACAIPPYSLPGPVAEEIREATRALAEQMQVCGLMNVQFAVKKENGRR